MKISILGAGTWGIALARCLCNSGNSIVVWSAIKSEISDLKRTRRHPNLVNVILPSEIEFTDSLAIACDKSDFIVIAVPSIYVRSTAEMLTQFVTNNQIIVDVAKGIENDSLMTMSEVISSVLPNNSVVALSGPTHAEEVSRDIPTAIVAANKDINIAERVQQVFSNSVLKVFTNTDVKGVELCGALKNIIALAAGIANGLGYGDNTKAALITRGLSEIERLGLVMGCLSDTFSGLAGIGDLIVTATSIHSRNNKCGYLIGQGYSVKDAINQVGMVVEGINVLPAAVALARKYSIDLPIISSVNDIVNYGCSPDEIMRGVMGVEKATELNKPFISLDYENAVVRNNSLYEKGEYVMKRIITYGTFDLLHYGHINLLRRAKALGDYLIVVISTDEFNWNEKHKKCYFTYEQRKSLVESIRYVDLVIPENNWNQKRSDMHEYHVDTFVMGEDWKGKFDFLKEEGVEVVYLPRTPEISTTQIKKDLYGLSGEGDTTQISHDDINVDPN